MTHSPMGFIKKHCKVDWFQPYEIMISYCSFDGQAYHHHCFERYGITLPQHMDKAVPKRKAEYLAGRICAKDCLAALSAPVHVATGSKREPIWPEGYVGSISHCGGVALAAVAASSSYLGIGIDVQSKLDQQTAEPLQSYILVEQEHCLTQSGEISGEQMLSLIFSIKESFFKAAFPLVREYFEFDAVTVIRVDHQAGIVEFELNCHLHDRLKLGDRFVGRFVDLSDKYVSFVGLPIAQVNQRPEKTRQTASTAPGN